MTFPKGEHGQDKLFKTVNIHRFNNIRAPLGFEKHAVVGFGGKDCIRHDELTTVAERFNA